MPDFPPAYITGATRTLQSAVMATESPFSFVQQVQDAGGERWVIQIEVKVTGFGFEAFANSVINKKRAFDLAMPMTRRAALAGLELVVDGAGQSGGSLAVTGDWGGQTLKAGDFFSIGFAGNYRLHQLTADAFPNGDGEATLQFVPRLRASPANGTTIELAAPKITLRATNPAPASLGFTVHQFTVEAVEAL